ncbi:MAG TPA: hypothetical protein VL326_31515 [Kofleriaceae bacterium]|jgi:hypothetical protein|nr:hypothetical protein [Kofleriaceae bacterium]
MDFVFMLTRADRTVDDALAVLDEIRDVGLRHIGFKDVGIEPARAALVHRRIKELGATSYLEVVSTSADTIVQSARLGRELGVDRLLGGCSEQLDDMMGVLAGSRVELLPFPGRPFGHPTQLRGSADEIERDCRAFRARGAAGCDLLAHRSVDVEPLELVRAARRGLDGGVGGRGVLLVAGGVASAAHVRALKEAGADAFTVGSAAFDRSFAPGVESLSGQLKAVLDACR